MSLLAGFRQDNIFDLSRRWRVSVVTLGGAIVLLTGNHHGNRRAPSRMLGENTLELEASSDVMLRVWEWGPWCCLHVLLVNLTTRSSWVGTAPWRALIRNGPNLSAYHETMSDHGEHVCFGQTNKLKYLFWWSVMEINVHHSLSFLKTMTQIFCFEFKSTTKTTMNYWNQIHSVAASVCWLIQNQFSIRNKNI